MTHKKIDANQAEIVKALRNAGAAVESLASIGKGCPDLLVAYDGKLYLMEIKSPQGRMTKAQLKWFEEWNGPVHVVRNVKEALAVIGIEANFPKCRAKMALDKS